MFTEDHYSRRYYQSPHTRPNKEGIRPDGPKLQDIDKVFILLIDLERIYFSLLYQALTLNSLHEHLQEDMEHSNIARDFFKCISI